MDSKTTQTKAKTSDKKKEAAKLKVRFLKSPGAFNLGFYVGDVAEVNAPLAEELIKAKIATGEIETNVKK